MPENNKDNSEIDFLLDLNLLNECRFLSKENNKDNSESKINNIFFTDLFMFGPRTFPIFL
jgi:hypothetical protein